MTSAARSSAPHRLIALLQIIAAISAIATHTAAVDVAFIPFRDKSTATNNGRRRRPTASSTAEAFPTLTAMAAPRRRRRTACGVAAASSAVEILASYAIVTASDMVPFVPCQPIAIAVASKLGWIAYPILVAGQTSAGILSFAAARRAADSGAVRKALDGLSPEAVAKFQEVRALGQGVGLRPFVAATILGCSLSNALNVGVGVGGERVLSSVLSGQ